MSHVNLFAPLTVGRNTLPNRVFMAPLTRNRAPDRVPNDLMVAYYAQRASAGLIVTEATQISEEGIGYPATPGIHSPEQVAGWRRIVDAVHARGGHIFAQLWHTGRVDVTWQPGMPIPVSASDVPMKGSTFTPRPLELSEIPRVIDDYVKAAKNAVEAGFDGVELHGANGYLIDQFLRDGTNRRTDRYGGSVENRARFALEATRAVADAIGADRTAIRLSPSSTFNDMRDTDPRATFGHVVRELDKLSLAYLHVIAPSAKDAKHGGPNHDAIPVAFFRQLFRGPLVANGGYDASAAQQALAEGAADAVAFGTAFLANPDLPERFRRNAPLNTPDPSTFYGGDARGYTDYPPLSA